MSLNEIVWQLEDDILEQEIRNEEEAVVAAVNRYEQKTVKAKAKKRVDELGPESLLIRKGIIPLSDAIASFIDSPDNVGRGAAARPFLRLLPPMDTSTITLGFLLNALCVVEPIQRTALRLADEIRTHLYYRSFRQSVPGLAMYLDKETKTKQAAQRKRIYRTILNDCVSDGRIEKYEWTDTQKLHLGMVLILMTIDSTGLIRKVKWYKDGRKARLTDKPMYRIDMNPEVADWLEKAHQKAAILATPYPPMLMPPREWQSGHLTSGGYVTNFQTSRAPLVKTRRKDVLDYLGQQDLNEVVRGVNVIQSTPWKINTPILEVFRAVVHRGGGMAGLVPTDKTQVRPPKPWELEGVAYEEYKAKNPQVVHDYCKEAAEADDEWARHTSKRRQLLELLRLADQYKERPAIWFPYVTDWRGRVYPTVPHLNPQSVEYSKALIQFAEGKPIGDRGVYWLMIHLANCAGVDKVSFNDRIAWVEEHKQDILRAAADPWSTDFWHHDIDDPFKFLAAAMEYKGVHDEGTGYISHLPVALDGSCNAYQHYAAMMRDPDTGALVNLLPADKPQDIYARTLEVTKHLLTDALGSDDETTRLLAATWLSRVDRKLVKRGTMTTPYGVTAWGIADQIAEELKKRKLPDGSSYLGLERMDAKASRFLGDIIGNALNNAVSSATTAMAYLQSVAEAVAATGKDLIWTTPSGFHVVQRYNKTKSRVVQTVYGKEKIHLTLKEDAAGIDKRSMKQAVAPCFVHSMDAAHLIKVANRLHDEYGIYSLATVHDSYATHPSDTDTMSRVLREEFVGIYRENVLQQFAEHTAERYPEVSIPEAPVLGQLDIEAVLSAPYAFA